MKAAWLALALCLGCNAIYDIDDTKVVGTVKDTDKDGVLDDSDNCIDVPNAGQEESDGDVLGDACDACPGTVADDNHDEDGDARPDACDGCPGVDDFANTDNDLDGVGDACDIDSHASVRVLFDPFVTLASAWQGPGDWTVSEENGFGSLTPVPDTSRGVTLDDLVLAAAEWSVAVNVVASSRWAAGDRAGIVMVNDASQLTSCTVECGTTMCNLRLVVDDSLVDEHQVLARPDLTLRLDVKLINPGTDLHSYTCKASDGIVSYGEQAPQVTSWNPGIVAGPTMRVSFVDVVQ